MDEAKMQEMLAEVNAELQCHEALLQLKASIEQYLALKAVKGISMSVTAPRSYIDDVCAALSTNGRPMHVKDIVARLSESREAKVPRSSLESSIIRHISKANRPRLAKFGPSTFGLSVWKQSPSLVQVAS